MAMAVRRVSQSIGVTPLNHASEWQLTALQTINHLAAMTDNWDSFGSPRIQMAAKEGAGRLLCVLALSEPPMPHIVPVPGGGLQLEWVNGRRELELEILPNGNVEGLATFEDGEMVEFALDDWGRKVPYLMNWLLTGQADARL